MSESEDEARKALQNLVKWSKERGLPPGEWIKPLQDVLKDSNMFSMMDKQFPSLTGLTEEVIAKGLVIRIMIFSSVLGFVLSFSFKSYIF